MIQLLKILVYGIIGIGGFLIGRYQKTVSLIQIILGLIILSFSATIGKGTVILSIFSSQIYFTTCIQSIIVGLNINLLYRYFYVQKSRAEKAS